MLILFLASQPKWVQKWIISRYPKLIHQQKQINFPIKEKSERK